jgi:aldehyde:ferredoxin oxidoreductase
MNNLNEIGYAGKILFVDLSTKLVTSENLEINAIKKWLGGVGLGAKYLYDKVKAGTKWSDPRNCLIWTTGPLAGTTVNGSGTINIMSKGPMTNLAGSSQANGFMGAYMKFCGYDGIVFMGKAPQLVYFLLKPDMHEIRDARHLSGKTVKEVETTLKKEIGINKYGGSVFAIGPAGENLVRHSCIVGDGGHSASHNGLGAVMGAKNLKAVIALKAKPKFSVYNAFQLKRNAKEMVKYAKTTPIYKWGTGGSLSKLHDIGQLPVKNYTTNIFPEHEYYNGKYMRNNFKIRSRPCYKCALAHVKEVTVTEGPYKGFIGEEPEYEMLAAWGPQIGNIDLGAAVMLANEVDGLGMDCNETSWIIGWAMECYQKNVFTINDTDGIDLVWGNVEGVKKLMNRIAYRQGDFANLLADGVMRASKKIGGKAADWAIYTHKGSAPRNHDHRGRWLELFDTCLTNTSTLEATHGPLDPNFIGMEIPSDLFSHEMISSFLGSYNGIGQFLDCTGTCRHVAVDPKQLLDCLNAATGWNWTVAEVHSLGRRIVNLLRVFNIDNGMEIKDERPSCRYGSKPVDGPNKEVNIMKNWDLMKKNYYNLMGWDSETGMPNKDTLEKLDLKELVKT